MVEWIAFSCSSSLVFAHQTSILAISLDPETSTFVVTQCWRLPFSGDCQVLAGGVVSNDELGVYEPYIVYGRKSDLWIGHISWDKELVECEVDVSLADLCTPSKRSTASNACKRLEGCWLADGPRVLCLSSSKLLVASSVNATRWSVDVLEFSGIKNQPRIHMFGTEAVLSLTSNENGSWSYFSFSNTQNPDAPPSRWRAVSLDSILRSRRDIFPSDLHPACISCCTLIPPAPAAAVTYLLDASLSAEPGYEVLIATCDKKLVRCRSGQITQLVEVEEVPTSLCFCVARGGQGTIFAQYRNTTTALCAETLQVLRVWSGMRNTFVADFMNLGHEQAAVLVSVEVSTADEFLKALTIANAGSETEDENFKMKMMGIGLKLLESRALSGRLQLEDRRKQRMAKLELLRSSCEVLQEMCRKHAPMKLVSMSGINHVATRNHLVITVFLQNVSPEEILLKNVSLLVTSIRGHLAGTSTQLDELRSEDGVRELSLIVPLSRSHIYTLQAINVLVAAEIQDKPLVEWLCRLDTNWKPLRHIDFAKQGPPLFMKDERLVIESRSKDWRRLADIISTSQHMDIRKLEENTTIELEGRTWSHFVEVSVSPTKGAAAVLTLRADNSQHLALLCHLVEKTLQSENDFRVLPRRMSPQVLLAAANLANSLQKERKLEDELETDLHSASLLQLSLGANPD